MNQIQNQIQCHTPGSYSCHHLLHIEHKNKQIAYMNLQYGDAEKKNNIKHVDNISDLKLGFSSQEYHSI